MKTHITNYFSNLEHTLMRMERAKNVIFENKNKNLKDIPFCDIITMSGAGVFTPQKRTSFLEDKMISLFSWRKVKAKENKGDYIDSNGKFFELKCSATNESQTINILQIRPWQNVDYYRIIFFDLDDSTKSKSYVLTKEEMLNEVSQIGCAIHGTKESNKDNQNIEYAIHLPLLNEWDEKYIDNDFLK